MFQLARSRTLGQSHRHAGRELHDTYDLGSGKITPAKHPNSNINIYIYIHTERERCVYVCVYIYIYREREI